MQNKIEELEKVINKNKQDLELGKSFGYPPISFITQPIMNKLIDDVHALHEDYVRALEDHKQDLENLREIYGN